MGDIKDAIKKVVKFKGGAPISSYKMTYDAQTNQLEPNYYWILDFIQDAGISVEKIVDNFVASPGSGHFSEMGQKRSAMQQQVSKIGADIGLVTKSIIQLIYDLREFEIRLTNYDDVKSKDKQKAEAAMIGLKQIWLDSVDIKKGHGAIHQMATQGGFTTVRDLFMMANSLEDVEKMSKEDTMNDQVKRILQPRVAEFLKWVDFSEKELRKRFTVEKSYLKSQVKMVQLYTSWIKPYLKAADELRQNGFDRNPALVNAFSTSMLEMTLFGKKKQKPTSLPGALKDYHFKRDYYACYVVSLNFRGPSAQRTQTGDYAYARGGRLDMTFDCYALNDEEINLVKKELEKDNLDTGLNFFAEETGASLDALKDDLEHFLKDDNKKEEEKKEKKNEDDINPFSALFSLFKSDKKKDKKKEVKDNKDIQKDNFYEKELRNAAAGSAKGFLYLVYDIYKKAHGMASSPENFDN